MNADFINAIFEFGGFVMIAGNCVRLYRDRGFAGVTIPATAFFAIWGYWNLFYYPSLDQMWSVIAAGLVALMNTLWIVLMFWFGPIKKSRS